MSLSFVEVGFLINLSRVQCPACSAQLVEYENQGVSCSGCLVVYEVVEGIPALLTNPNQDTALDVAEYEIDNPPDPVARARTFGIYQQAMRKYGVTGGVCLELGSGTGNLTVGLVNSEEFDEVHCSDISIRFLRKLRKDIPESPKLHYWIFDASKLPFRANSVNTVFGHSVLHHLLHYEKTLEDVFRVLSDGGMAMFGEPVMDSHALLSLCAGLILQLETRHKMAGFNDSELDALRFIRQAYPYIGKQMRENRENLASTEDKHVYVISDFLKLARSVGFEEADYINAFTPDPFGSDQQHRLTITLGLYGVPAAKLKPYNFIFDEMTQTYGEAMGAAAPANFGYFMLKKRG